MFDLVVTTKLLLMHLIPKTVVFIRPDTTPIVSLPLVSLNRIDMPKLLQCMRFVLMYKRLFHLRFFSHPMLFFIPRYNGCDCCWNSYIEHALDGYKCTKLISFMSYNHMAEICCTLRNIYIVDASV